MPKKVLVFLPEQFEETEAVVTVDLLRRSGADVQTVSLTDNFWVTGSHGIKIEADTLLVDIALDDSADMLVLPGGLGTPRYLESDALLEKLARYNEQGKYLAAICAAPTVLGGLGLLQGRTAICYPGLENGLAGAELSEDAVAADGNIITAKGAGTTMLFGLRLVEKLMGKEAARQLADSFIVTI